MIDQMWLFFLVAAHIPGYQLTKLRVHDGDEDVNNEFPFAVSMELYSGWRYCTGSLIAPEWVLTAAHCMHDGQERARIRYGDFTLARNETKKFSRIIKEFPSPGYLDEEKSLSRNDIGLLLVKKVIGKEIGKMSAVDAKALVGYPVKYAGFGLISRSKSQNEKNVKAFLKKPLQVGEAVIMPCKEYDREVFDLWVDSEKPYGPQFCLAPKCSRSKQGARRGDSGGPLIYDGKIIGVCQGFARSMTRYIPVSPYLGWITSVIQLEKVVS